MDAKRLSETKALLKRRSSLDRSKPMVEDAAHPGSAGMLRQISAGHFDLKHHTVEHDASKPMLEAGTGFHTDVRPAVFAEVAENCGHEMQKGASGYPPPMWRRVPAVKRRGSRPR